MHNKISKTNALFGCVFVYFIFIVFYQLKQLVGVMFVWVLIFAVSIFNLQIC